MKILITTTQDRFFLSHLKERAIYFKEHGCIVGVAAQKTSNDLVKEITELGLSFFDTKIERRSINPLTQLLCLLRLFKIQTRFKPDVSYHLGAKSIFYGTCVARLYNPNVGIVNAPIGLGYVFASSSLKARILKPIVLLLYKYFLNPKRSRVIIENNDDIRFFIKQGCLRPEDAFCILGAGVDTNIFAPVPFLEKNKVCTVVMASRLIREKGVFDFVKAANLLNQARIPVRMQLIGAPDYGNPSSITKAEFEKIKSDPSVECLDFQPDVLPFFKKAHICCLPSFYREGLPRVLIEAASSGLALITTDTIGCKEAIRDNNGFLVQPNDVSSLVKNISFLVNHPDELKEMGERSRKVAKHYFDSQLICRRTFEIIKTLFN